MEERWGAANQSYYTLSVSYFSNPTASALMGIVSRDFLWARTLSSTPVLEADARDLLPGRLAKVAKAVEQGEKGLGVSLKSSRMGLGAGVGGGAGTAGAGAGAGAGAAAAVGAAATPFKVPEALAVGASGPCSDAVTAITALASELLRAQATHASKRAAFCSCRGIAEAFVAARAGRAGASEGAAGGRRMEDAPAEPAPALQHASFAALASSLEVAATKVVRS